ncbi:MAG: magnesium transporter CorA family protein [Dehalococcoidia bacterium]|nr:magnesium transporter CorA family protein [Dehalococcoidia bacterium]
MSSIEQEGLNIRSITERKLTWFYIEKPTSQEVAFLAQRFHFHPLDLDDVLSRIQRPKIDVYKDYLFIVLHFPVFDKENRITRPSETDIFIGENYVVTVHCTGDLKPLARFFQECETDKESRESYLGRSSGFLLYHILDRLVGSCFPILDKVTQNIDDIEDIILTRPIPATVREISLIRRDLISFRRVIHPQIAVIETLEKGEYPFLKEEEEIYFGDIADHIRKIWGGLEDCKEVIDGLADTSNWLTSHRIQEIMRLLTIIMGLLAPPTLIASIYGMNLPLPGGVHTGSLLPLGILLALMAIIAGGIFFYMRHRRYL